jgi:hypothetical protein
VYFGSVGIVVITDVQAEEGASSTDSHEGTSTGTELMKQLEKSANGSPISES